MDGRSVAFFQAEDVGDDIVGICTLNHNVRHGAMRSLKRGSQYRARRAWSVGNDFEGGSICIGRSARHFIHEVALSAYLTR